MDFIFEIIAELFFEAVTEASKSKKLKPWVRMLAKIFIAAVFVLVILLLAAVSVIVIKQNLFVGIMLSGITICTALGTVARMFGKNALAELAAGIIGVLVGFTAVGFAFILMSDKSAVQSDTRLLCMALPVFGVIFTVFGIKGILKFIKQKRT